MSRPSMMRCVGVLGVASMMLAVGCQHAKPRGMTRGRGMPVASAPVHGPYAATAVQPIAQPVAQVAPPAVKHVSTPTMLPPVTQQLVAEPAKPVVAAPAAAPSASPSASPSPVVETAKGNPDQDTTTVEQAANLQAARVVSQWTSRSPKNEVAPRRSFVDITAHACFGHADDYCWLSGQLQHLRTKECWRLRYASVDEDDPHGGSVTLVDNNGLLSSCKDGQYVRITGRLLNAAERSIAPSYHMDSLQVIDMK